MLNKFLPMPFTNNKDLGPQLGYRNKDRLSLVIRELFIDSYNSKSRMLLDMSRMMLIKSLNINI